MSLLSALLDLIFPAKCPFCGRVLDRPGICGTCRGELPWTEGADALRRGPGGFLCAAPLWYQGLAREGLHRFKFRGMSSAATHVISSARSGGHRRQRSTSSGKPWHQFSQKSWS